MACSHGRTVCERRRGVRRQSQSADRRPGRLQLHPGLCGEPGAILARFPAGGRGKGTGGSARMWHCRWMCCRSPQRPGRRASADASKAKRVGTFNGRPTLCVIRNPFTRVPSGLLSGLAARCPGCPLCSRASARGQSRTPPNCAGTERRGRRRPPRMSSPGQQAELVSPGFAGLAAKKFGHARRAIAHRIILMPSCDTLDPSGSRKRSRPFPGWSPTRPGPDGSR